MLETERLILRRWEESDAEDLYEYAKDAEVGPIAGWPPHQSIEESLDVIRNVFNGPEAYAICLKSDHKAIGAIELKLNGHTDLTERDDECELGYWLGKPFWGQGIVPEAAREILRHAFEDIAMQKVWCGYYDDVNMMTRDNWLWRRLYEAAKSVQNGRKISDYVEAGGVAAAILSSSGRINTGVCVDTSSTLGICAERNAVFNMLTNGEQEICKVLAVMPNGKTGAPCGACRELMVQLMPKTYKDIEIMLDYEKDKVVTLGELTPEWWI